MKNENEYKPATQVLYRVKEKDNTIEIKPANQLTKKENETFGKTLYTEEALMRDYGVQLKQIENSFRSFEELLCRTFGISLF